MINTHGSHICLLCLRNPVIHCFFVSNDSIKHIIFYFFLIFADSESLLFPYIRGTALLRNKRILSELELKAT